eukprot:CAMPEP_0115887652 /NCGR_PEP_ID=MMETSP0287-20121206/31878_1 /TAXON_ID=412157 /ORGANISM="Chrysochromulina rotalis, Strain UIO044" /LENGTH=31 /DNA_ID= /DNA_START= /DNA_END= /DNA_ORIENTATION=
MGSKMSALTTSAADAVQCPSTALTAAVTSIA